MKKIDAYIKPERLKPVLSRLRDVNAPGFTYYHVTGHGREAEAKGIDLGKDSFVIRDILPRIKIEIFCEDSEVEKLINAIRNECCTNQPGDGMAFISPVKDAYRLKSKEKLEKIE